jgi:hypothetical protein
MKIQSGGRSVLCDRSQRICNPCCTLPVGEWRAERNKRHGRCREHGRQRDQGHADRNPLRAEPPCRDTFGIHVYGPNPTLTLVANSYAAFRAAKGSSVSSPAASLRTTPPAARRSGRQPSPDVADGFWRALDSVLAGGHTGGYPARGCSRYLPGAHTAARRRRWSAAGGQLAAPRTAPGLGGPIGVSGRSRSKTYGKDYAATCGTTCPRRSLFGKDLDERSRVFNALQVLVSPTETLFSGKLSCTADLQ